MAGYVVTGGTGALGRALVLHLVAQGERVAVPYRDASRFEALRAEAGTSVFGQRADVADPTAARGFIDAARAWLGRLDGVAALAGGYRSSGPFDSAPDDEWDAMLRTNLAPVHAICRAALPHLLRTGGTIVTVGSRSAEAGGAGAAAYATSKMAVLALTRALALENRERGVRVNAISPATIDTEANRQAMPRADRTRWTRPEDIAGVVAFLLSPASAPVTGAVIPV